MKQADQVEVYVEQEDWTGFTFEVLVEKVRFAFANFRMFGKKAAVSAKK